eukprot:1936978-Pleurochrysis_carterae.AAC.2
MSIVAHVPCCGAHASCWTRFVEAFPPIDQKQWKEPVPSSIVPSGVVAVFLSPCVSPMSHVRELESCSALYKMFGSELKPVPMQLPAQPRHSTLAPARKSGREPRRSRESRRIRLDTQFDFGTAHLLRADSAAACIQYFSSILSVHFEELTTLTSRLQMQ